MKFSHAWLQSYVPIHEEPSSAGARITAAGIALDGIEGEGERAVYDFDIPANRPDCMNHLGLAREYAALVGEPLRRPDRPHDAAAASAAPPVSIRIDAPDLCRRYSARVLSQIRVGPSPPWLKERLEAIGQRPINNVVDATNFVLWEMGHPLHAFDLDHLEGGRVLVRQAAAGESLVTLDGVDRRLLPGMLVIADARRPVALAGIMGGRASEIAPTTRGVLLESAWFDPVSVRRTARALGLHTDASHRFERGADPEGTIAALDRAAAILAEVASARLDGAAIDVCPAPFARIVIPFRPSRVAGLLGFGVDETVMRDALTRREFDIAAAGPDLWQVTVPSFRRDVSREVDLIEEVARHRGYRDIPSRLPLLPDDGGGRGAADRVTRGAREALLSAGFSEAINYSMVDGEECRLFGHGDPFALTNPLQTQAAFLRTTLLPGLLRNVAHNLNHGVSVCRLFEIGLVFRRRGDRPDERLTAALVLAGRGQPAHWSSPRRDVDFYDARGALDLLAERLGLSTLALSSDRIDFLEAAGASRIARAGRVVGSLGEVARSVRERYGIDRPVFCLEIDLAEEASGAARPPRQFKPLPRFPAVRRDLSLLVGPGTTFEAIERVIRRTASLPVSEVEVFDRYRGPGVPAGSVSLAIQIAFQHPQRTLAAEEVQQTQDAIVRALGQELGVTLRGSTDA
jgi:phenylalanyl-tRNA synthetase beta chain